MSGSWIPVTLSFTQIARTTRMGFMDTKRWLFKPGCSRMQGHRPFDSGSIIVKQRRSFTKPCRRGFLVWSELLDIGYLCLWGSWFTLIWQSRLPCVQEFVAMSSMYVLKPARPGDWKLIGRFKDSCAYLAWFIGVISSIPFRHLTRMPVHPYARDKGDQIRRRIRLFLSRHVLTWMSRQWQKAIARRRQLALPTASRRQIAGSVIRAKSETTFSILVSFRGPLGPTWRLPLDSFKKPDRNGRSTARV